MKKGLLLSMACALGAAQAFAVVGGTGSAMKIQNNISSINTRADEESLIYGYCYDYKDQVGTGVANSKIVAAIQVPDDVAMGWKGNAITAMQIGFGQSSSKDITIFITKDLDEDPLYTQEVTILKEKSWNTVEFETPFALDGEGFYVGFEAPNTNTTDYPVGVDMVLPTNDYGDIVGTVYANGRVVWEHIGSQFGNNLIRIVVSGDNLPKNDVSISGGVLPQYVKTNTPFTAYINLANNGLNPLQSVEAKCSVGGKEQTNITYKLSKEGAERGEVVELQISGLVSEISGDEVPIEFEVTKVNGQPDDTPGNNAVVGTFISLENAFDKAVVVEEFTGTWCQFCPRGIEGMKYMEKNYGDKGFIGIAGHFNDNMQSSTYLPVVQAFSNNSYPSAVINRTYYFDPSASAMEFYYKYETINHSPVGITANSVYSEENNEVSISSTAVFGMNYDAAKFNIAYVLTEDNVGPYYQVNGFAGGKNGGLEGWSDKGSAVETLFNEVAREINAPNGAAGSLPAQIVAGTEYKYNSVLSTSSVSNINNAHVIAMVIDTDSGKVVNGVKVPAKGSDAGVEELFGGNNGVVVAGLQGSILVRGDYKSAKVYTLDGKKVADVEGVDVVNVPAGLYIVNVVGVDGKSVNSKVVVR